MKQTKALRRMLQDMTAIYHERLANGGDVPEVTFTTGTPHASENGDCGCDTYGAHVAVSTNIRETYGKSLDGPDELRVLVDTLNHEDAHHAYSVLTAKRDFIERYPQCPKAAGMVLNVLEDQYIDWQRLKRFRGLRGAHSFKVDAIMSNGSRRPPLYNLEQSEAVFEGFLQMAFSGYVKGFSKAPREVQEAIVKCRPLVDTVRNTHDEYEREAIAHTCLAILLEAVPDPEDADEYVDENQEQMPTDQPAELSDQEIQDLLDDLEPEDLEQGEDGEGQAVEIDPEKFDVPEWLEDEMEPADSGAGGQDEQEQDEWADEREQEGEGADDGEQAQDEQEMGEQDLPEQEGEKPGEAGEDDAGEQGGDSEAEQEGEAQEGGDETEGSAGQDGQQGEADEGTTGSAQQDDPYAEAGDEGERSEDTEAGGADPVEQGIQEMERRERERRAGDHWEAGDSQYEQPDDEMVRRYDTIQQEVRQAGTEVGQQKQRRDEAIERVQQEYRSDSPERVREELRSTGLAEDIVAAFKKFKTQDRWLPDTRGERLHTRNAVRRLAGDHTEDRVYERKLKAEVGDRCVGVAMDLSGSMSSYDALKRPKMALGALYLATRTIGDDILVTGYKTYDNHPQKGRYEPILDLATAHDEQFEWDHLDALQAGMYTPTADGVMYTLGMLKRSHRREKVLVVVTDGKANIPLGGSTGTTTSQGKADAKRAVNTARQQGVKVIGLAVGTVGDEYMDQVFGANDWIHTSSDTLTEDLVALYRSQMRTAQQH